MLEKSARLQPTPQARQLPLTLGKATFTRIVRWRLHYTLIGLLLLAIFLFPVYWMVITSIKPDSEILTYPPHFVPNVVDFSAYQDQVLRNTVFLRYLLNSGIVGVGTMIATVILASPAAYALAQFRIRGKFLLLVLSMTTLFFPSVMLALPLFVIFSPLRLTNSYVGLILANTALNLPFAVLVLRPTFLRIPAELTEAALIDGCNKWTAFFRVVLPLAKPGLATAAIFAFLAGWNDLVFALSFTDRDTFRPVTAGIWNFISNTVTDWNGAMAYSTLALLPTLLFFIFVQRYVISGLTTGSVK
jgi:multiple sugar transport system permease protein